jgi:hypothetical protein
MCAIESVVQIPASYVVLHFHLTAVCSIICEGRRQPSLVKETHLFNTHVPDVHLIFYY